MIRLENLSKSFPDGNLFSNVNLSLKYGMRAGLVGANGTGKTTLLRIMLGKVVPDSGGVQMEKSTSIGYLEQDIISGSNRSILEEVLASYPEVRDLEGKMFTLSEAIANKPGNDTLIKDLGRIQNRFEALDGWMLEEKSKKILSGLGFTDNNFTEPMNVFSGGWRMRVALASLLIQEPHILFLDEPTNHLDLEATIWLESFLSDWKGGMIIISHDRAFLDRSVNHIIEIDLKKVTLYHGNYSNYKRNKVLQLEQHRSAYKNQQKKITDTEKFIERFRYKNTKATQVQSRVKMLEKMEKISVPTEDHQVMNLFLPQPSRPPSNLAFCKNVIKYYDDIEVFNGMNMVVDRGQKIGLVGHNGAGKSTLLKMLAGVEPVTSGEVQIGSNVSRAYYAQHQLETLEPDDTVFDSIQKVSPGWSETKIRTYLGSFLFTGDEIEKFIKVLSGGEKARLALARMLMEPSHLLLLDEPTNHLDMVSRNVVETALVQFTGSIVCISHDRHFLNKVTNLTCEVSGGRIHIFDGNYEYYIWKTGERATDLPLKSKVKTESKSKSDYQQQKKIRNRLAWIGKRFKTIEKELDEQRIISQNPAHADDYELLQKTMEMMNVLEAEYLELMEEEETLE